jgi:hypothetical protein
MSLRIIRLGELSCIAGSAPVTEQGRDDGSETGTVGEGGGQMHAMRHRKRECHIQPFEM